MRIFARQTSMFMNTLELKNILLGMVAETDDPDVLRQIIALFNSLQGKGDWWESMDKIEKERVELGRQQAANGEVVPHEAVRLEVRKIIKA